MTTGLEDRDTRVPPCDSLAEAMVLSYFTWFPERMTDYELMPLLVFPEHRALFQSLRTTWTAASHDRGLFACRWEDDAERVAKGLSRILGTNAVDSYHEWRRNRVREQPTNPPVSRSLDVDYWYARVQRVAAARQLVDDAQRITEHAWRGDVDGALEVATRIRQRREVVRIDV